MKNLIIVLILGIFFSVSSCTNNETDRGTQRENEEMKEGEEQKDRDGMDDGADSREGMDTTARRDNDDVNY